MIFYAPVPVTDRRFAVIVMLLTIATAFSMVSPVRYRSQKGLSLQKERSLMYFVAVALILGLAFRWPREFWFAGAIAYLVSGPLVKLWSIAFPKPPGTTSSQPVEIVPAEAPPTA
jgi:phosphatidylserine synthase